MIRFLTRQIKIFKVGTKQATRKKKLCFYFTDLSRLKKETGKVATKKCLPLFTQGEEPISTQFTKVCCAIFSPKQIASMRSKEIWNGTGRPAAPVHVFRDL